ncbi:MAG: GNAT family N-acetyltransferase, partial [bacterium]|nr:GNAT family N-acetyltransferase [bacterium]
MGRIIDKKLVIRRYKDSDRSIVWRLHVNGLNQTGTFILNPKLDSDFEAIKDIYINKSGEFLIASLDKEIVGMGALKKVDNKTAEIKRIRVDINHQQKG